MIRIRHEEPLKDDIKYDNIDIKGTSISDI